MELSWALNMFERSEDARGVRYVKYLGDGDSKAFEHVTSKKPYGDRIIEKLECIGHVQKRLGSRLRRLKNKMKGRKLADDKVLGGKGRLTDAVVDKLQTYYGLAIRRNVHDKTDMKNAIWAIFDHKISTDENPQHDYCPKGQDN